MHVICQVIATFKERWVRYSKLLGFYLIHP